MANVINATSTGNGGLVSQGDDSGILNIQTNETTAITVDASQRVAFVAGTAALPAITTAGDTNTGIYFPAADTIAFSEGGAESMRIDSSGNLLVGTTSTLATGSPFQVSGPVAYSTCVIKVGADGNGAFVFRNAANTTAGSIGVNTSSTTYATSSDYRLKESIAPMTGALAKVAQLKPVTYKWKVDGSDGEGFIAHELAEVKPDCVSGDKDAVDADGNPVYQGIDTSFLVATLTAAIQELKAEVDELKAKVNA